MEQTFLSNFIINNLNFIIVNKLLFSQWISKLYNSLNQVQFLTLFFIKFIILFLKFDIKAILEIININFYFRELVIKCSTAKQLFRAKLMVINHLSKFSKQAYIYVFFIEKFINILNKAFFCLLSNFLIAFKFLMFFCIK